MNRGLRLRHQGAPLYEDSADLPELNGAQTGEVDRIEDFSSLVTLFDSRPDFFLRVRDKELELQGVEVEGLKVGDVVAVKRGQRPEDEDVAVGRVGDRIALRPAWRVRDAEFDLIGVVIGGFGQVRCRIPK